MKKIKNILTQNIVINLMYALITVIYFIVFSMQYSRLTTIELENYLHISSFFFLIFSIILMEISLKKNKGFLFINGIEFSIIAVFVLLTQHMSRVLNTNIQLYTLAGANSIAVYYIFKSAILYTKEQQDRLNSLSDIKEIVKDEPIKKASKRKNKKEEGK